MREERPQARREQQIAVESMLEADQPQRLGAAPAPKTIRPVCGPRGPGTLASSITIQAQEIFHVARVAGLPRGGLPDSRISTTYSSAKSRKQWAGMSSLSLDRKSAHWPRSLIVDINSAII